MNSGESGAINIRPERGLILIDKKRTRSPPPHLVVFFVDTV
jgi:hypothetical protein